jgi:hypothetical protein
MSHDRISPNICAQVNAALESRQVLEYLEWFPEKMIRSGDIYLAYCPIHKDKLFRTLALNPRNNTCHCHHMDCPQNQTSDFLELIVKASGKTIAQVIRDLVVRFGADQFNLAEGQMRFINEMAESSQSPWPGPGND